MELIENSKLRDRIKVIRQERIRCNLTVKEMASIAHTTPATFCLLENGFCHNLTEAIAIIKRIEESIFMIPIQ